MIKYLFYILILFYSSDLISQQRVSPFNKKSINVDSTGNYSFIVSGHFHGSATNKTGLPTNTILAHLDWINNSDNCMVISLGDLFLDVSNDIPQYEESFFSKLNKPMFNAVGNHDLTRTIYQDNFGETFFYWEINNDIHVVLDTELDDGSLQGEQLDMLKNINKKVETYSFTNVFIYSHRTIWAKTYPELDLLFKDNTQSMLGNNFKDDILPILKHISNKSNVFWFSGSIGDAPASFFQFKDQNNIQYIATAIRGFPRDAILLINVNKKGEVSFKTKSLTNQELLPFELYDVEFWNKNTGKKAPFNYRLVPLYIKQNVFSRTFWYGFTIMLIISLLFFWKRK